MKIKTIILKGMTITYHSPKTYSDGNIICSTEVKCGGSPINCYKTYSKDSYLKADREQCKQNISDEVKYTYWTEIEGCIASDNKPSTDDG